MHHITKKAPGLDSGALNPGSSAKDLSSSGSVRGEAEASKTTLEIARELIAAGISVFPTRNDGTPCAKAPGGRLPRKLDKKGKEVATTEPFWERFATEEELKNWFAPRKHQGIALACGRFSGGLEVLDFEDLEAYEDWKCFVAGVSDICPDVQELPIIKTPNGGRHVLFRSPAPEGNQKLAHVSDKSRGKNGLIVETRGEGGYVATVPHDGYEVLSGDLRYVPTLERAERDSLVGLARALDSEPRKVTNEELNEPQAAPDGLRPGEDFDLRGPSFAELMEPHGWELAKEVGEVQYLRRPGSENEYSATAGHCVGKRGEPLLYVFSSAAQPFEELKSYGKFRTLVLLKKGSFSEANYREVAGELRGQGFGGPVSTEGRASEAEAPKETLEERRKRHLLNLNDAHFKGGPSLCRVVTGGEQEDVFRLHFSNDKIVRLDNITSYAGVKKLLAHSLIPAYLGAQRDFHKFTTLLIGAAEEEVIQSGQEVFLTLLAEWSLSQGWEATVDRRDLTHPNPEVQKEASEGVSYGIEGRGAFFDQDGCMWMSTMKFSSWLTTHKKRFTQDVRSIGAKLREQGFDRRPIRKQSWPESLRNKTLWQSEPGMRERLETYRL